MDRYREDFSEWGGDIGDDMGGREGWERISHLLWYTPSSASGITDSSPHTHALGGAMDLAPPFIEFVAL